MNLLATDEKSGELYCKQCRLEGNENSELVKITKEENVCPKCHSTNTSEIDDLKNDLTEQYKNIILDCRNILHDFHNFSNSLSLVKQKLVKLRLEDPVIIHEPGLEEEILAIIQDSVSIEQRIINRVKNFFLFLKSKKPYFFSGKPWQNQDFSILETYIQQLQADFVLFMGQVSETFNDPMDSLQNLKDRLSYLESIKDFYQIYMNKGTISLGKHEFPVIFVEDVKIESDDDHKGHGHILLTTKNFKYVKSQGVWKKTDSLLFSFPIDKILSVDVSGKIFKRLNIQFQGINLKFNIDKDLLPRIKKAFDDIYYFEENNPLSHDKIMKIKNYDMNSIFKIKVYIEENINALLSSDDGYGDRRTRTESQVDDYGTTSSMPMQEIDDFNIEFNNWGANDGNRNPQEGNPFNIFQDSMPEAQPINQRDSIEGAFSTSRYDNTMNKFAYSRAPHNDQRLGIMRESTPAYQREAVPLPQDPQETPIFGDIFQDNYGGNEFKGNIKKDFNTNTDPKGFHGFHANNSRYPRVHPSGSNQSMQKAQETRYLMSILRNYEHKQISLNETLKNLEIKFNLGKVAPNVYFQTHQLFQEKLIGVQQEILVIRSKLNRLNGFIG
ncbi:MAG: hypothetical protein ACFFCS_06910 [Candidatus Hodarchaeota archaeon]